MLDCMQISEREWIIRDIRDKQKIIGKGSTAELAWMDAAQKIFHTIGEIKKQFPVSSVRRCR